MKYRVPEHTAGPWTAAVCKVTETMLERITLGSYHHAVCTDAGVPTALLIAPCGDESALDSRSAADARLFAAAPAMLEFLQGMLSSMARPPGGRFYVFNITPELYDDLNARIVKAIDGVE